MQNARLETLEAGGNRPVEVLDGLRLWLLLLDVNAHRLPETGEEEGLVDPTVEDRDAQLDALRDYVSALETGLTRKLGWRQANRRRSCSSFACVASRPPARRLSPTL